MTKYPALLPQILAEDLVKVQRQQDTIRTARQAAEDDVASAETSRTAAQDNLRNLEQGGSCMIILKTCLQTQTDIWL